MTGSRRLLAVLAASLCGTAVGSQAAAAPPGPLAPGEARVVAKVPLPGQPEGMTVDPRDGSFWTGSNRGNQPGTLWHYAADGTLLRTYQLTLERPSWVPHGINGIVLDGDGLVYALDYGGAHIIRLDPATGRQEVYARFPDLPLCLGGRRPCEPSFIDRQAWPNWGVFDEAGNLYVSDINQATIWKVPAGGGAPTLWHQSQQYASFYGPNGMQFDAQGRLVWVMCTSLMPSSLGRGVIYRTTITPDGRPGRRERLAVYNIGDGLAIGKSGRLYLPLSEPLQNHVQVIDPETGRTVDRIPDAATRRALPVPMEAPASVAFRGTSLLVSNHALYTLDRRKFAVIEVGVGEEGLPLHYPHIGPLH